MSAQTLHKRSTTSSSSSVRPRQPTDAFRGLVAFFPKGTHSTAIYTWTSNKGILASLGGVESGDFPVDVIFSRAGDPFLSRLPKDLDVETLDFAWINASLQAGKLCEVAPFRLSIASSRAAGDKTAFKPLDNASSSTETAANLPSGSNTASGLTHKQRHTCTDKKTAISLSPPIHASGDVDVTPPIQPQDMPTSDAHEASHNSQENTMHQIEQTQAKIHAQMPIRTSQPPLHKRSLQPKRELPLIDISKLQRRPVYSRPVADVTELSSDDTHSGTPASAPAHTSETSVSSVVDVVSAAERLEQLSQKIQDIQHLKNSHSAYMTKLETHADELRRKQAVDVTHANGPRFPTVGPVPWGRHPGVTQAYDAQAKALKLEEAETDGMFRRLLDYGSDDSGQEATALSFSTRKGLPAFKREEDDSVLALSGTPVSLRRRAHRSIGKGAAAEGGPFKRQRTSLSASSPAGSRAGSATYVRSSSGSSAC